MIQGDIGINSLALNAVRNTYHGRFGNFRMRHQRGFDLGGAQAVPRHVQYVIHTASDPVVAVLITSRAIAAEIGILKVEK